MKDERHSRSIVCQGCSHISDLEYLCTACVRRLYQQLTSAAVVWRQLQITVTRQSKTGVPQPGGKSGETPLAFDEQASDAAAHLRFTLERCVAHVVRPEEIPSAGRFDWEPATMAVWLRDKRARIAELDHAGSALSDIVCAVAYAYESVDHKPVRIYLGKCSCGWQIFEYPDAGTFECRCGTHHDIDERRADNLAHAQGLMVTAKEASEYLAAVFGIRIKPGRITVWGTRGKVGRVFDHASGEHIYRLGDVLKVLRDTVKYQAEVGENKVE